MTPLETIKEGILNNNMEMVAQGYNRITNQDIQAPARRLPPPEPGRRENYRPPTEVSETDFSNGEKTDDTHTYARVEPFQPRKRINMWADDRTEVTPDYTKADKDKDMAARNKAKTQRPAPYTPTEINCVNCGKRYKVNPVFVIGGTYRCDRCTNQKS